VSATAALLVALGATPAEARGVLLGHALDLGMPGFDWQYGHGLLDAAAAVEGFQAGDLGLYDPPPELGPIDVDYSRLMLRVAFDTTEPTWARLCDDAGTCVTDDAGVVTRHALRLRTSGASFVILVGDAGANRVQAGPFALP